MDDEEMENDGRWFEDSSNDGFADWISIWIMILVWNLLIVMVICTHHACKFLDRLCCDKGLATNSSTNGSRRHGTENTEEETHSVATTVQDEQDFEDCIKVDTTSTATTSHERTNEENATESR